MIQVTIAGNVGKGGATVRDAGKDKVCGFSVASTAKNKDGEVTTWFDCSVWGRRGEAVAPHIKQGDKITVVGELSTEEFNGKTRLRVRVSDFSLQGGKGNGANKPAEAPSDPFADLGDDAF